MSTLYTTCQNCNICDYNLYCKQAISLNITYIYLKKIIYFLYQGSCYLMKLARNCDSKWLVSKWLQNRVKYRWCNVNVIPTFIHAPILLLKLVSKQIWNSSALHYILPKIISITSNIKNVSNFQNIMVRNVVLQIWNWLLITFFSEKCAWLPSNTLLTTHTSCMVKSNN